jgi:light-regulated signal transduction histidine kinase (bacteriophytochrome)
MTLDLRSASQQDPELTIRMLQRELEETNHEVLLLNLELEKRVEERTAELETAMRKLAVTNRELERANRELEAFSYSVSHDLRAPLRAVTAFSSVVLKDFGEQMPAEAQRLLNVVITGAGQMKQMIDDLLRFSRLARQPLERTNVPLSILVREIIEELRREEGERSVDVRIHELRDCIGDASLLRQVFVNLLSNAFKFTRQKQKPMVEVGSQEQHGERVYFVRDNGAGFDMRYAEKLFGVFQRLHDQEQFQGTGVGLSIVQRIIERHGGRIWAEAEVEKGATFYFTLPE